MKKNYEKSFLFFLIIFSVFLSGCSTNYQPPECGYNELLKPKYSFYHNMGDNSMELSQEKECYDKVEYSFFCGLQCRVMFIDLADTWGTNTNNQDSISKTIFECQKDCVNDFEEELETKQDLYGQKVVLPVE